MIKEQKTIIVAAGGTGGHLFPAEALAAQMQARGFVVHLFTDERARDFVRHFAEPYIHIIPSATIKGKNPYALFRTAWLLWQGMRRSRKLFSQLKPSLVVGFGGYPTLPPLYAATRLKIPTLIHEQNAVMGRANRFLSSHVDAIAGGFLAKQGVHADKITVTGNPLRPEVIEAAAFAYQPPMNNQDFKLLIFGGSQGASFFSMIMPQALSLMPPQKRARLKIIQQARPADLSELQQAYGDLAIKAEIAPFFSPMAEKMKQAHLIIARAGASTVAEIAAIGRPCLLVPYPGALDHDQAENARLIADSGGAKLMYERDLNAKILYDFLDQIMDKPQELNALAHAAKQTGQLQATQHLADLAEQLIMQGRNS